MKHLNRFFPFLLGLSIAFYTMSIGGKSVGFILSILYLLLLIPYFSNANLNIVLKKYGKYLSCSLWFIIILTVVSLFYLQSNQSFFPRTIFLNWLLFLMVLLHSVKDNKAPLFLLLGYSIGTFIVAVCFYLGIGVEFALAQEGERFSIFGMNSNILGIMMSYGITIMLNIVITDNVLNLKSIRFLFFIPILLEFSIIIATGSRTAFIMIILVIIISIFLLPIRSKKIKFIILLISIIVSIYIMDLFLKSENTLALRLINAVEDKDTSGRFDIWSKYLSKAILHPVLGVGQTGMDSVAQDLGLTRFDRDGISTGNTIQAYSPHNVLIEVFLMTGIVGLFLMMVFWFKPMYLSIKYYKYTKRIAPLSLSALLVIVLFSGQMLTEKYAWVSIAYVISLLPLNANNTK